MKSINTAVRFQTSDSLLQKLINTAEEKSLQNLKDLQGFLIILKNFSFFLEKIK